MHCVHVLVCMCAYADVSVYECIVCMFLCLAVHICPPLSSYSLLVGVLGMLC